MRIDRNVSRGVKSIRVGTTVVPTPDHGGYNIKMIYPPGKPFDLLRAGSFTFSAT